MSKYIDAHCHVLSESQMRSAQSCGVEKFVVNATRPDDWNTVIELSQRDSVYGAIGVHPWFVLEWNDGLPKILSEYPNLMVGEFGLDKNHPDMEKQVAVYTHQLQIAHDLGRIAHMHCVGCWGKMMEILRGVSLPPAMLFHCFSGSVEIMRELVKMNAYFSFGSAICDEKYVQMREAVVAVPENRILVESDAPDGTVAEKVPDLVTEIAKLRGVAPEYMAEVIYKNTLELLDEQSV